MKELDSDIDRIIKEILENEHIVAEAKEKSPLLADDEYFIRFQIEREILPQRASPDILAFFEGEKMRQLAAAFHEEFVPAYLKNYEVLMQAYIPVHALTFGAYGGYMSDTKADNWMVRVRNSDADVIRLSPSDRDMIFSTCDLASKVSLFFLCSTTICTSVDKHKPREALVGHNNISQEIRDHFI